MFKITIVACGNKMPAWVDEAVNEFSRRLREYINLTIVQIPLSKRSKSCNMMRILEKESALVIAAIPHGSHVIALDIEGESFSSDKLALKFAMLQHTTSHLCLLIGGPEGLSPLVLTQCNDRWSLSALTLPHPLVRIILLEAIYRAWSINNNHPYHK